MSDFVSLKKYDHEIEKTLIVVSQKYQKGWNPHYSKSQWSYQCHNEWRKHGSYSSVICRKNWKEGLQKFWIRYDIGDHTRYLPVDFMYEHLGTNFCSSSLNGDILPGNGMKSKIVSKKCNKGIAMPIQEVPYFF